MNFLTGGISAGFFLGSAQEADALLFVGFGQTLAVNDICAANWLGRDFLF